MVPDVRSSVETKTTMLPKMYWKKSRTETTGGASTPSADSIIDRKPVHDLHEDDATDLHDSFASLAVTSSSTMMGDYSFSSSTAATTSLVGAEPVGPHLGYKLLKNEHDCFGYLKFQACVSCVEDVPLELAMVSGKSIMFIKVCKTPNENNKDCTEKHLFAHPLLVEVLESHFILVAITPEEGQPERQEDGSLLTSVKLRVSQVGFLDERGLQHHVLFASRGELSTSSIMMAFVEAVVANQQVLPKYFAELAEETLGQISIDDSKRRAWFGFVDVEAAEVEFQYLDGVHSTMRGRLLDREETVIEVLYDSKQTSFGALVHFALSELSHGVTTVFCQSNDERMAARVELVKHADADTICFLVIEYVGCSAFVPSHDLTALQQTPMRFVPLTDLQAMAANRLIRDGLFNEATHLLSPRQGQILMEATRKGAKNFHDVVGFPILEAWISLIDGQKPRIRPKRKSDTTDWEPDSEPEVYSLLGAT